MSLARGPIDRYTKVRMLCDVCHGAGRITGEWSGREGPCFGCDGRGVVMLQLHGLADEDLEQLSLVACAELHERARTAVSS